MRKIISLTIFILTLLVTITFFHRCNTDHSSQISKIELGKLIFFDSSLSEPPGQSCATCHRPERGFADTLGRDVSEGAVKGLFGKRNSMTISYTAHIPPLQSVEEDGELLYTGGLFWDGRADSLAHQAGMPFLDKLEMANDNEEMVVKKIMKAPYYKYIAGIYGETAISPENRDADILKIYAQVVDALAAYQASDEVNPYNSKFDDFLAGKYTMSENQEKGYELFKDKALCSQCHILDVDPIAGKVLFTDFTYDNLGLPKNNDNKYYLMESNHNPYGADYIDIGLMETTKREDDRGKFRVPTLRNIEKTAPYGHNGCFKTLEDIIHFYNVRDISDKFPSAECPYNINKDELGNLGLTTLEESYLIEFLKLLSDK